MIRLTWNENEHPVVEFWYPDGTTKAANLVIEDSGDAKSRVIYLRFFPEEGETPKVRFEA